MSGSGKSSLAFDTIYAEGQRRYVESLSSYARQFLGVMEKPDVDSITGLSPAISIEQKTVSHNPRSTVGTVTELNDYLRLFYARVGIPHCPKHNKPLKKRSAEQIVNDILQFSGKRIMLLAPIVEDRKGEHIDVLENLVKQGFVRFRIDGQIYSDENLPKLALRSRHSIDVIIDRLIPRKNDMQRLLESVQTSLEEGNAKLRVVEYDTNKEHTFSSSQACPVCAYSPPELEPKLFSFNASVGACSQCYGLGDEKVFAPELLILSDELSIANGAIDGWDFKRKVFSRDMRWLAKQLNFSVKEPYKNLSEEVKHAILYGYKTPKLRKKFEGVVTWIKRILVETESQHVREYYSKFLATRTCTKCDGTRLNDSARAVTVGGLSLPELSDLSLEDAHNFVTKLKLDETSTKIATMIVKEVKNRLEFLVEVGLGYLNLSRTATTLSGGENQRIRLASQVGSGLTGVTYVLDEPSIGLHSSDNQRLLNSLERLRDQGNTVLVVEHDEEAMMRADNIVDVGPGAGLHGGKIVATGKDKAIIKAKDSITGQYLSGKKQIDIPKKRVKPNAKEKLKILGAKGNNLKNLDVSIPLGLFTCVTGVSGSGKSSLITDTLHKSLMQHFHNSRVEPLIHKDITGLELIDKVIDIDQSPIGRTPRSNPATYTGLFTPLRQIFSELPLAREWGYKPGHFSFNVEGGRCDHCEGDGVKRVEMHFLPDVFVTCDECKGKRYKEQTLEVKYRGKSIHDVLEMTVNEAQEFFKNLPVPKRKLDTLTMVGLDYVKLGQGAPTLSGGEAQRIKLALELSKVATGHTLYLLDEPTTGLHFFDIDKLLKVLQKLRDAGNTVVVVEHNLDVIKTADWIIDLGPGGGVNGGKLIGTGCPEDIVKVKNSKTGQFLRQILKKI